MSLREKWKKLPPDVFTGLYFGSGWEPGVPITGAIIWTRTGRVRGYGESAARLAVRILKAVDGAVPIKLSTEADNKKAQRLYEKIGFQKLDELDGDDLVFCL